MAVDYSFKKSSDTTDFRIVFKPRVGSLLYSRNPALRSFASLKICEGLPSLLLLPLDPS